MPDQTTYPDKEDESVDQAQNRARILEHHFRFVLGCGGANDSGAGAPGASVVRILDPMTPTSDNDMPSALTRLSARAQAEYWQIFQVGISGTFDPVSPLISAETNSERLIAEVESFANELDAWASKEGIDIDPIIEGASSHFRDDYLRPRSVPLTEDEVRRLVEDDESHD